MRLDHAHVRDTRGTPGVKSEQSDGPRAQHDRGLHRPEPQRQAHGMDRVRERLDERADPRIDGVRQEDEVRRGNGHTLGEASSDMDADEPALGA